MKKKYHLIKSIVLFLLIISYGIEINAQSFSTLSPSGHNLNYSVIHSNAVAVSAYITTNNSADELIIPDSVSYNNTTYRVKKINQFTTNGITSIIVPNTVITIAQSAFSNCNGLISITIGRSVDTIGKYALANSSLTVINFNAENCRSIWHPNGYSSYTSSYVSAFGTSIVYCYSTMYCNGDRFEPNNNLNISILNIGDSVRSIPDRAFMGLDIQSITVGSSVDYIGGDAFKGNSFDSVIYTGDISQWCNILFVNKKSNPIIYSGNLIIHGSTVANLVIPNGVQTINDFAFTGLSNLTSVTLPASITYIGDSVFDYYSGPTSIILRCYPPTINPGTFSGFPLNIPIHVPCGALSSYMSAANWSNFTHFVEDCATITVTANDYTLGGVTGGGTFTVGDTVTLTAIPYFGSRFIGWSNGSQENPLTFVATTSQNFVAAFAVDSLPQDTVYIHDTTYITLENHDTVFVNHYVHDTLINHVHDTTFINNYA